MTRDDIIRMAREAGFDVETIAGQDEVLERDSEYYRLHPDIGYMVQTHTIERFAALVAAAEREKVARWQIGSGYSTGHGETIEDLLVELEWQVRESEREACAQVCEEYESDMGYGQPQKCADAIRARGETK